MSTLVITNEQARRLAVTRQYLAGPRPKPTPATMLSIVRDLGCVQLDPISAVSRSHTLVMWSRLGSYKLADFDSLLYKDRSLFEYWAHVASIVPTEDYQIHRMHMRDVSDGTDSWFRRMREWKVANHELHEQIIAQLRDKGPLLSREFEDKSSKGWKSSGWTNERNVSRMLDYMWLSGEIMVTGRKGLQKVWDLADRVLPNWTPHDDLPDEEIVSRAALRAIRALGVTTPKQINLHYTRGRYPNLPKVLQALEKQGTVQKVQLEGDAKNTWYIHAEDAALLDQLEQDWQPRTTLLSPFDNLICDRDRTEALFNFYFRIEIYVPKDKRQYGYYVLPILHGDRLIGRIDPLMDRKNQRLMINNVYAEQDAPMTKSAARDIGKSIAELGTFLGAKEIVYGDNVPDKWKLSLKNG